MLTTWNLDSYQPCRLIWLSFTASSSSLLYSPLFFRSHVSSHSFLFFKSCSRNFKPDLLLVTCSPEFTQSVQRSYISFGLALFFFSQASIAIFEPQAQLTLPMSAVLKAESWVLVLSPGSRYYYPTHKYRNFDVFPQAVKYQQ